jgi:chromosome partitioning protein
MIISILNQKGGSGKTTLAAHLARAAQADGKRVLLVDADRQGSLRDWHAAGDGLGLDLIAADTTSALASLPSVAQGYDLVVVDGMPSASPMAAVAIKVSDGVLVPIQPSPLDLWAANDLLDMIRERQSLADGQPRVGIVVSRAVVGSRLDAEMTEALAAFGCDVLDARTHQRVVYPGSMASGRTALDAEPEGAAAHEIRSIWKEVKQAWL